ncbi:hypothetical protein ALQ39_05749, partial [Pseudomonas amygdali pv. eriobotryae]
GRRRQAGDSAFTVQFEAQTNVVLRVGILQRFLLADRPLDGQIEQRRVEGLHTEAAGFLHDALEFGQFIALNQVANGRRAHHHLHRCATFAVRGSNQPLGHERLEVIAQVMQQLRTTLFREEVDDPVQRLIGVVGMQGRDRQVAGVGKRQRMLHGLAVTNFADQNHIRSLTQRVLQRRAETAGIDPHLALVDDGLLVAMDEFDRVFNGDDMAAGVAVAVIDQRCQRGRFARAGGTDEQHQAVLFHDHIEQYRRQEQVLETRNIQLDIPRDDGHLVTLHEDIDPEPADARQRNSKVHLQFAQEFELLLLVHQPLGNHRHLARFEGFTAQRLEHAVELGARRRSGGKIQVRSVLTGQNLQQRRKIHNQYRTK